MNWLKSTLIVTVGAAALAAAPARCNDSAAELSTGGLQFVRTNDIAMESEDLRISPRPRHACAISSPTPSGKPVTLTVAFPLPDIDLSEAENIALPSSDPVNFVDFETKIDGAPRKLQDRPARNDWQQGCHRALTQFKLPLLPIGAREIKIADLPAGDTHQARRPGPVDARGNQRQGPAALCGGLGRKNIGGSPTDFSAGAPGQVDHQYKPFVGTSPDTILRASLRSNKSLSPEVERYRKEYCISDAFLAELDKRAGNEAANSSMIAERRINYVLKTGANWAGPIRSFKLTIDPGVRDAWSVFVRAG